jgi:hypothetical protein
VLFFSLFPNGLLNYQQIESSPEMLAWDWQIPSIFGGFVNPPGAVRGHFQSTDYTTLPDNFSDTCAETDIKRLAKPFYSKTILQIVFCMK